MARRRKKKKPVAPPEYLQKHVFVTDCKPCEYILFKFEKRANKFAKRK